MNNSRAFDGPFDVHDGREVNDLDTQDFSVNGYTEPLFFVENFCVNGLFRQWH